MSKKTHWKKKFNYDYMGSYSLQDEKEAIFTIRECRDEKVKGTNGREESCLVCYFHESEKPMILNRTNCKAIEKVAKTGYIESWKNVKVQLYVEHGVSAFGETVDALRIRTFKPKIQKSELTPDHPAWSKVIEYIKGGGNISEPKKKYSISSENESLIMEKINNV